MKVDEIILESMSSIAYHCTTLYAATNIMKSGQFELSVAIESDKERSYATTDKPYFLSVARSKSSSFFDSSHFANSGALFVLDGNWFNRHYVSRPVDYWQSRSRKQSESEDRVISGDSTIQIGGVREVHVLLVPQDINGFRLAQVRTILLEAKKRGIAAYYYEDHESWKKMRKERSTPISKSVILKGKGKVSHNIYHRGYIRPWLELVKARDRGTLSPDATSLITLNRDQLVFQMHDLLKRFANPGSGNDRINAVKVIQFMKENKFQTVEQLVDFLIDKWANK